MLFGAGIFLYLMLETAPGKKKKETAPDNITQVIFKWEAVTRKSHRVIFQENTYLLLCTEIVTAVYSLMKPFATKINVYNISLSRPVSIRLNNEGSNKLHEFVVSA